MAGDRLTNLPAHYGCVLATGCAGVLINLGLAARVVAARRRLRVKFPAVFAADKPDFNRALQHHLDFAMVEMPAFYFALLTGGLQAPRLAATAGAAFLVSRSLGRCYAASLGGLVGEVDSDRWSMVSCAAFGVLLAASVRFGVSLLRD